MGTSSKPVDENRIKKSRTILLMGHYQWRIQDSPQVHWREIQRGGVQQPNILTNFPKQKLHENEENWTPGGHPLDPPLTTLCDHLCFAITSSQEFISFVRLYEIRLLVVYGSFAT